MFMTDHHPRQGVVLGSQQLAGDPARHALCGLEPFAHRCVPCLLTSRPQLAGGEHSHHRPLPRRRSAPADSSVSVSQPEKILTPGITAATGAARRGDCRLSLRDTVTPSDGGSCGATDASTQAWTTYCDHHRDLSGAVRLRSLRSVCGLICADELTRTWADLRPTPGGKRSQVRAARRPPPRSGRTGRTAGAFRRPA